MWYSMYCTLCLYMYECNTHTPFHPSTPFGVCFTPTMYMYMYMCMYMYMWTWGPLQTRDLQFCEVFLYMYNVYVHVNVHTLYMYTVYVCCANVVIMYVIVFWLQAMFDANELITQCEVVSQRVNKLHVLRKEQSAFIYCWTTSLL